MDADDGVFDNGGLGDTDPSGEPTTPRVEIHIHGPNSVISNFPAAVVSLIKHATSYTVDGYQFSKAFRSGRWDGRKHLYRPRTGAFPTGLVPGVRAALEGAGLSVDVVDHRKVPTSSDAGFGLHGVTFTGKYDYQQDVCEKMVAAKQGIVKIATNGGKSLRPDVPVRLFDGSVKAAQHIVVGDQLMGPDSRPRTVLSTNPGYGPMYEIMQKRGMSYGCNDVHVLTLQSTESRSNHKTIDIPLDDYLDKGSWFKHVYKHFSVGVEYPTKVVPLDSYLFGLWLGDGTKKLAHFSITTMDPEIVEYLQVYADKNELTLNKLSEKSSAASRADVWSLVTPPGQRNPLLTALREATQDWSNYMINDRATRLSFLAGILDSDGHYVPSRHQYELTLKQKDWTTKVYLLARSLGYACAPPKSKKVKLVTGEVREYWRIHIRGVTEVNAPPCLLPRKQVAGFPKKGSTRTKFGVVPVGDGPYSSFTLDGDGRFLLEDYTVTHNTECASAVAQYLGLKTLFIVTTRELLYQAQKRFMLRLQKTEDEIGLVGDGHWSPGSFVTVATLATLESRINTRECQQLLKEAEVMFIDECHHVGSETWYTVATLCPAYYRFGLSGTPLDRTDGANLRLIAATGEQLIDIRNKFLVERGISAKAHIIFDKVTTPVMPKKTAYATAYKQGVSENPEMLQRVVDWAKIFYEQGLGVLILTEEIQHGKLVDDALWTQTDGVFIPHQYIYGEESSEVRQKALADFSSGQLPVLVASTILDEGVDVPTIDALILAGSRKSRIRTLQRTGRGLRGARLVVVEFANFCHKHLIKHSLERLEDYKNEECFPIHHSKPDADLVRRIWSGVLDE